MLYIVYVQYTHIMHGLTDITWYMSNVYMYTIFTYTTAHIEVYLYMY